MAEETKIGIKLEEETKPLKKLCEKLEEGISAEFNKGIEQVDVAEMKEAIDMLKDLYEAKEKMVKACYYKQIMEAMEEHDFEDEEEIMDEGRRGYRSQRRDSRGRYMSRRSYTEPMMMRDDMREKDYMDGRMYYGGSTGGNTSNIGGSSSGMNSGSSDTGSRGYSEGGQMSSRMQRDNREGRSGEMRRGYMESKEQGKDKSEKMQNLEEYAKTLTEDVTEMVQGMSPEEKALLKNKMQTLMTKIQ